MELIPILTSKYYLPEGLKGLYEFQYEWGFENFQHILNDEAGRLKSGDISALISATSMDAVKKVNEDKPRKGVCIVVDVETYLATNQWENISSRLLDEALKRAGRHKEWLLFPIEGSESGGISGRFCPNKYLKVLEWLRQVRAYR